jgi:hypothetical protein
MKYHLFKLLILLTLAGQPLYGQFWSSKTCKANPNLMHPRTQKQIRDIGDQIKNSADAERFVEELYQCYGRDNRRIQNIITII